MHSSKYSVAVRPSSSSSSSSSSCRASSTDIHDNLSPTVPITHCSWEFHCAASSIRAELVNVCLCWTAHTGFNRRMSLMSLSLLLQQCPACLVCLTRMVCVIGNRWPYSCFLVGSCFYDLFKTAHSILVQFPSSLFFRHFVRVQVVQLYSSTDTIMEELPI